MMIRPEPLRAGDVVRIVAPCGPFARESFLTGVDLVHAAGFVPRYDDGVFSRHRYLAGDDARRLAELSAALADEEAKAIWVARGGYGATRLLPRLSVDAVGRRPRWLVGFSDATALHALWQRAGVMSVHGPNITTLGQWSGEARAELFALLGGGAPPQLGGNGRAGNRAVAGPLVGGNLTVLAALCGTGFLPPPEGAVLLLEDIGERPYRLDRAVTQLVQAGALRGVAGVALGQLTDCRETVEPNADYGPLDALLEVLAPLGVPVVSDLPLGHEGSARAALLGGEVELDPAAGLLRGGAGG